MSGPKYAFPALTPTYGLGSGNRIVGAAFLGSPRTKIGSANRIYTHLSNTAGKTVALNDIRDVSGLGPFIIQNNKLVWN